MWVKMRLVAVGVPHATHGWDRFRFRTMASESKSGVDAANGVHR